MPKQLWECGECGYQLTFESSTGYNYQLPVPPFEYHFCKVAMKHVQLTRCYPVKLPPPAPLMPHD